MATLISKATGNFTDSGTWAPISGVAGAEVDVETAILTNLGGVATQTFVLEAVEVDGVALKVASRVASPTGTITVKLENVTSPGVRESSVTINQSDITAGITATVSPGCWYLFKFSPVTPNGTDTYRVAVSATVVSQVNFYRTGTAGDLSRMIRLTSAASAPATGDKLVMIGELTGQGTSNSFTVTMDNTATTSFGGGNGMVVGDKCTLVWGNVTSTAYYLKVKGTLAVTAGGTLSMGTVAQPINASGATAVLEFDSTVNVDSGLNVGVGATCNIVGATKTNYLEYLTADKAAAATTLAVGDTTGWAANDELGIASTTQTFGQCEKKTIQSVDSGSGVTLTAGLTNAHSGTSPTQAEVINLTRNVKVRGVSASLQGYVFVGASATVTFRYAEFTQLGSGTANKRGIDVTTITGTFDMQYCSLHDSTVNSSQAINFSGVSVNNFTYSNNVSYNIQAGHVQIASATSGTNWFIQNNVAMLSIGTGTTAQYSIADFGGTFTGNIAVGASSSTPGFQLSENGGAVTGTFSDLTAHSGANIGIQITNLGGGTVRSVMPRLSSWRNLIGISFNGASSGGARNITFDQFYGVGNSTAGVSFDGTTGYEFGILFTNATLAGDTTFAQPLGIRNNHGGTGFTEAVFENCSLGETTGIRVGHSTADLGISFGNTAMRWILRNCKLASSTELSGQANILSSGSDFYIRSQRHDQTAGLHKTWFGTGTVDTDTATYRSGPPSERLTPNNASSKLESSYKRAGVVNGGTLTPTVHVKKSGTYNGNAPRLIVKKNVAAGIAADAVLATLTGSADADGFWTLSGTTAAVTDDAVLEFVVDCDGTAGVANVDDWSVV